MAANSRAGVVPVIAALGFALAGCSSSGPQFSDNHHARYHRGQPSYRAEPYQVKGAWYTPKVDYGYDETGTASWYGPGFDQQATADGEIYDMNQLSAAHKTLPLPSVVAVTNLGNGRELRLRVNDRGPFVDGRLIDVSRRAAQLLGFEGSGTAPVRVKIIKDESIRVAEAAMRGEFGAVGLADAAPSARTGLVAAARAQPRPVTQVAAAGPASLRATEIIGEPLPVAPAPPQSLPAAALPEPAPVASPRPAATLPERIPAPPAEFAVSSRRYWPSLIAQAHAETQHSPIAQAQAETWHVLVARSSVPTAAAKNSGRIFVQAGAFAVPENAQRVRARIAALGSVEILSPTARGTGLYRVRLGPVASEAAAARLLGKVIGSGYPDARVISD
jgi:peptidoglycan lytic transglycosylase